MPARLFSKSDDEVLKELYSTKTNKELVEIFNGQFSTKQIKNRGKDLGLHKDLETKVLARNTKSGCWEEWEVEIVRKHFVKDGITKTLEILDSRSKLSLVHKAHRMGLKIGHENVHSNYTYHPPTDEVRAKMSKAHKGVPFSEEHKKNHLASCHRGPEHRAWRGGHPTGYDRTFSEKLKQEVKKRDGFKCAKCGKKPATNYLVIHHIDYNKLNSVLSNLLTLCAKCHLHHHHDLSEEQRLEEQTYFQSIISGTNQEGNG